MCFLSNTTEWAWGCVTNLAAHDLHRVLGPCVEITFVKQIPHDDVPYQAVSREPIEVVHGELERKMSLHAYAKILSH